MSAAVYAKDKLRGYVERIERLDEEAKAISADKSEIYKEARGNGFDVKAMKEVVRQRRKEPGEVEELTSIVDLYRSVLGMGELHTGTDDATRAHDPDPVKSPRVVSETSHRIGTVDESPAAADRNSVAPSAGDKGGSAIQKSPTGDRSAVRRDEGAAPTTFAAADGAASDRRNAGGGHEVAGSHAQEDRSEEGATGEGLNAIPVDPVAASSNFPRRAAVAEAGRTDGSRLHHGTVDAAVLLPGVDADGFMVDDIPERFRRHA